MRLSSFHWVISRYCLKIKDLKALFDIIKNEYFNDGIYKNNVFDTGIYKAGGWFRCINQYKPEKGRLIKNTEHTIIKGDIKDFVLFYTDESELKEYVKVSKVPDIKDIIKPKNKKIVKVEEEKEVEESILASSELESEEIEKIKSFLNRINPDLPHNEWISVAYSLYNILNEDYEESLNLFNEWSSKGTKYKGIEDIRTRFNSIQKTRKASGGHKYKIKNLIDLANKYNPIQQDNKKTLKNNLYESKEDLTTEELEIFEWLNDNLETAEHVKNEVFKNKKNEFMWILDGKDEKASYKGEYSNFYCFDDGRWYNHAEKLFKYIKTNFYNDCKSKYDSIKDKLTKSQNTNIRGKIMRLLEPDFQEKILKCSMSDDSTKKTNVKFDENPELLGFDNGILDLKTGLFRPFKYNDFVSMSTGWDYLANEEGKAIIDETKKKEVYEYLYSMFASEEEREVLEYLLYMFASSLNGYTYRKFFILTGQAMGGGGSNGKSRLNVNHCRILGKYAIEEPKADLLFGNKTGPSPELVALEKKRYIRFTEPDSKQAFSVEFIQSLCGGTNRMSARNCFSNKTSIYISGTVSCECNKTPDYPSGNNAARDRLRVAPFNRTFSNGGEGDAIIDFITVFPTNSTYTEEWFFERRMEWLNILLPYSIELLKNPLEYKVSSPKIVVEASSVYLSKSNVINQWFDNKYEKGPDKNKDGKTVFLSVKDVYDTFTNSQAYKDMTKKEKRETNYNKFIELFTNKKGYKAEWKIKYKEPKINIVGELIKGEHHRNILIGYIEKNEEVKEITNEEDEEYDEEE